MAFRASTAVPMEAYRIAKSAAAQLKLNLTGQKATLASSGADYVFLQNIYMTLKRATVQFDSLKTTPGLAAYAQDQENDPAYDVASAFSSMQSAINGAIAWMNVNVPTNVVAKTPDNWDGGEIIATTFTPGQTSGLITALQSVIDEIV